MILTQKQLDIIDPIKKIAGLQFYELQINAMQGTMSTEDMKIINQIVIGLDENQIKQLRKIRIELINYKNSLNYGYDLIKMGTKIIGDLL